MFSRRKSAPPQRYITNNGYVKTSFYNVSKLRRRLLADMFTTLVDVRWRFLLLIVVLTYTVSWFLFAGIWYFLSFTHGDLDNKAVKTGRAPCLQNVQDFSAALLVSIETQSLLGYGGNSYVTSECNEAVLLVMVQTLFGALLQALLTGLIFTKIQSPKRRAHTLQFSKHACICQRDGELCLTVRIGNMRKSQLVDAHARAILIQDRVTEEGDFLPHSVFHLDLGSSSGHDKLFLAWPVILTHKITAESPLWELSPDNLLTADFEIIFILEGVTESTSMCVQARSSYLPSEILWGKRFKPIEPRWGKGGLFVFDYADFNETVDANTAPLSSASLLHMSRNDVNEFSKPCTGSVCRPIFSDLLGSLGIFDYDCPLVNRKLFRPRRFSGPASSSGYRRLPYYYQFARHDQSSAVPENGEGEEETKLLTSPPSTTIHTTENL